MVIWPWPWISRSTFENAVSQEWDGWLTWNKKDVNRWNVGPMLWLSTFPSPMTLTLDFQGQILKMLYLRNGLADWHGRKGCESIGCYTHFVTFNFDFNLDLDLGWKVKFWKSRISGMGWPIDMEQNGFESMECWTHVVTFNTPLTHDLDLGFSRSNFENALSQEWDGQLPWNERDVSR